MSYLLIAFCFGISTGIVGKMKGSSFLLWFAVGAVLPVLGLVAAFFSRSEHDEPERRCDRCGKVLRLYVQVCPRCGEDLYLPDPSEVRRPQAGDGEPPAA